MAWPTIVRPSADGLDPPLAPNSITITSSTSPKSSCLSNPSILQFPPFASSCLSYTTSVDAAGGEQLVLDRSAAALSGTTRRGACEGGRLRGWPGLSSAGLHAPIPKAPFAGTGIRDRDRGRLRTLLSFRPDTMHVPYNKKTS